MQVSPNKFEMRTKIYIYIYKNTFAKSIIPTHAHLPAEQSHIWFVQLFQLYNVHAFDEKHKLSITTRTMTFTIYICICAGTRGKGICLHMYMNKTYILYLHIARSMLNLCSLRALINVVVAKQNIIRTKNSAYNWYKNNVYHIQEFIHHTHLFV